MAQNFGQSGWPMKIPVQIQQKRTLYAAYIVLLVAFIATGVSFFAPYWRQDINRNIDEGLWGTCTDLNVDERDGATITAYGCIWFMEDDSGWERSLAAWHKAAQALFAFGFVSVFAVLLVASVHLCCCCRDSRAIVRAVGAILLIGSLLMLASVGVYGGFSWQDHETSPQSGTSRFNWGFYLGIGGSLVALLAALMYLIESCRWSPHEGYQRGDVV